MGILSLTHNSPSHKVLKNSASCGSQTWGKVSLRGTACAGAPNIPGALPRSVLPASASDQPPWPPSCCRSVSPDLLRKRTPKAATDKGCKTSASCCAMALPAGELRCRLWTLDPQVADGETAKWRATNMTRRYLMQACLSAEKTNMAARESIHRRMQKSKTAWHGNNVNT